MCRRSGYRVAGTPAASIGLRNRIARLFGWTGPPVSLAETSPLMQTPTQPLGQEWRIWDANPNNLASTSS